MNIKVSEASEVPEKSSEGLKITTINENCLFGNINKETSFIYVTNEGKGYYFEGKVSQNKLLEAIINYFITDYENGVLTNPAKANDKVVQMVTHLTTAREVYTEFSNIDGKVKRFSKFNTYISVEVLRAGYSASKPTKYTFDNLNLLNLFYNLLVN